MRRSYRTPHPRTRIGVVYMGHSQAIREISEWGMAHGVEPVERPDDDSLCAIIDQDIWEGELTESEDRVLREIHQTGLPCLSPDHAWPLLISAVHRGFAA